MPRDEAARQFTMATREKQISTNTSAVRFALLGPMLPGCSGSQSSAALASKLASGEGALPSPCWAGLRAQSCQFKSPTLGLALILICLCFAEISSTDLAFPGIFIEAVSINTMLLNSHLLFLPLIQSVTLGTLLAPV